MNNSTITTTDDFFIQAQAASENSLLMENSSNGTEYTNKDLKNYKTTDCGLIYMESWFIEKYYDRLRETATLIDLSAAEDKLKYYCDPRMLSYDRFGTVEYWYLILLLNYMTHPTEFRNLTLIWIPDVTTIEEIISEETNNIKSISN